MHVLRVLIPLLLYYNTASGYKILGIFPHTGKSHFDVFEPLMKALAAKGHHVTVISHFPQQEPLSNYRDVSLKGTAPPLVHIFNVDDYRGRWFEKYVNSLVLAYFGYQSCVAGLASKQIQEFLKANQTFDLIAMEFFNTDCFLGLAHKFKAPVVSIGSCSLMPWHNDRFGNPDNPSYIPVNLMRHSDRMSFFERVENTVAYVYNGVVSFLLMEIPGNMLAKKYFGDDVPDLRELAYNTSLMLENVHFSLTLSRPQVPNIIDVGGIHIGKIKQLPENVERWISESSHGVIYFSLGSMIKGHTFPEDKRRVFQRAFARLKQRVLWKWENDTMPEKPDNVMIRKWMPQLDILCHPNVKAFISHGGLLGTTEAVHCGVPVIAMPQYGDQFTNAKALEASGGGVIIDFRTATEEQLYQTLKTVLDPKFNKQAKELSARFRDRPMPPLETAIYWVEYVARHKGAPFMRSAAVGMPLYKYLLLDVIAFLLAVFAAFAYVVYALVRALIRVTVGKSNKKEKKQ